MLLTLIILSVLFIITAVYLFLIRPWHLTWGATASEVKMNLPGDELVPVTNFNATRAISINALPVTIWKWIIQIGSKRAGWYSIDWIDNGGEKSSFTILPEFQKIENGQFIPFTPDQKNGMWVSEFIENHYILWKDKDGKASWVWYIYTNDEGVTRLITRLRTKYNLKGIWIIYYLLYDLGDIIMMKKCMEGIKLRAEKYS